MHLFQKKNCYKKTFQVHIVMYPPHYPFYALFQNEFKIFLKSQTRKQTSCSILFHPKMNKKQSHKYSMYQFIYSEKDTRSKLQIFKFFGLNFNVLHNTKLLQTHGVYSMDAKFCLFFHARARMVQQKRSAFSPQLYVAQKLEEAKLQWKKEKLNNIGVLQKKVLVSEIKIT